MAQLFGVDPNGTPAAAPGMLSQLLGLSPGNRVPQRAATPVPSMPLAGMGSAAGVLAPNTRTADGTPAGAGAGELTPNAIVNLIGTTAQKDSIAPMTALRTARLEGGFASAGAGDHNSSFGPLQLHYGGAGQR